MPLNDQTKLGLANRFTVVIDFASYNLGSWAQADGLDVVHLSEHLLQHRPVGRHVGP